MRRGSWNVGVGLLIVGVIAITGSGGIAQAEEADGRIVLEDFQTKDENGAFPANWKGERGRSETSAREAYTVRMEEGASFLSVKGADQRIHKKIAWDPKAYPILTWRWRLQKPPQEGDPIAVVFVALDTDLLFIPVLTKYVWSMAKPEGTTAEGGIFSASEIVVQTGPQPIGEWIEERVNAYEDFKRIHQHEPAEKAWGISLLGGTGAEVDFGSIAVTTP